MFESNRYCYLYRPISDSDETEVKLTVADFKIFKLLQKDLFFQKNSPEMKPKGAAFWGESQCFNIDFERSKVHFICRGDQNQTRNIDINFVLFCEAYKTKATMRYEDGIARVYNTLNSDWYAYFYYPVILHLDLDTQSYTLDWTNSNYSEIYIPISTINYPDSERQQLQVIIAKYLSSCSLNELMDFLEDGSNSSDIFSLETINELKLLQNKLTKTIITTSSEPVVYNEKETTTNFKIIDTHKVNDFINTNTLLDSLKLILVGDMTENSENVWWNLLQLTIILLGLILLSLLACNIHDKYSLSYKKESESQVISKGEIINVLKDQIEEYKSKTKSAMEELNNIQTIHNKLNITIADQEKQISESIRKSQSQEAEFKTILKDKDQLNIVLKHQCSEYENKIHDLQTEYQSMKEIDSQLETIQQENKNMKVEIVKLVDMQKSIQQLTLEIEKILLEKDINS